MDNRSIDKDIVRLDLIPVTPNSNSQPNVVELRDILKSELNRLVDEISEAKNYHELTKHIAEQLITQLKTFSTNDRNRRISKRLIQIAMDHGIFSRPEEPSTPTKGKIPSLKGIEVPAQDQQFRNTAHKLLSTYSDQLQTILDRKVSFAEGTVFHEKKPSKEEEMINKFNEIMYGRKPR